MWKPLSLIVKNGDHFLRISTALDPLIHKSAQLVVENYSFAFSTIVALLLGPHEAEQQRRQAATGQHLADLVR